MNDLKTTQISLKEDSPTGISSTAHGSNINGVAFNLDLISKKNPVLATKILKDYHESLTISPEDPSPPDEDFDLATDELSPFKN